LSQTKVLNREVLPSEFFITFKLILLPSEFLVLLIIPKSIVSEIYIIKNFY